MVVLYGIKNCDTCKRARSWLDQHQVAYQSHDFRVDGITESLLQKFIDKLGWEAMLNKSSTSWRQLTPRQQADLTADKVKLLMLTTPTLIKRPVLEVGSEFLLGFKPDIYAAKLK